MTRNQKNYGYRPTPILNRTLYMGIGNWINLRVKVWFLMLMLLSSAAGLTCAWAYHHNDVVVGDIDG